MSSAALRTRLPLHGPDGAGPSKIRACEASRPSLPSQETYLGLRVLPRCVSSASSVSRCFARVDKTGLPVRGLPCPLIDAAGDE